MTNPAREALTRAVNKAIAEGAPVYVNKPDLTTMPTLGVTESGGEIKVRRPLKQGDGLMEAEIVLAYLPHNEITPFVTWQRNTTDGSTYWGHYFRADESAEAVDDFFKRGR